MSEVFIIDDVPVRYEDLFRAPEKDGAVVSVRVHKSVKELLTKLAEKEGLDGVSELLRYLVAGYIMGKYKLIKPEPKVITQPIFLNVNINKKAIEEHTDMAR
ncbi:ribbon-helix-helix protein, CopG family [Vulcanisaeta sp. JCM 16159]|uniref:ribbon-helix-helix protein, CopG family n=1 Tax=Vulcanisaeta sp. JCM 16159 TaxID=1295371 RepID=UPI0006D10713|nr:ribbon-helix-helix protein, CopG family [Vulcanisaeta sp. JCM 16159]